MTITCPRCEGTDTQPDDRGRYLCVPCGMTFVPARDDAMYPYSCRIDNDHRMCPICDASIRDGVYAIHWEAAHPSHSRVLRTVEWNVPLLDAWAGQGYPLPDDSDAEPADEQAYLTESEIHYLAHTWTDTHGSFMDAVHDALAANRS